MEKVRCGPLDRRQSRSWPGGSRSAAAGPTGPAPPHPSSGQEAWGLGQGLAGPAGGARVPAWFQGPGAGPALPGEGRGKGVTGGDSGSQKFGGPGPIRGRAPRAVSEHRTRTPWRAPAVSPPEPWTEPAGTAGCWRGPRRPPPAAASGRVGRAASSLCSSLFASAPLQNAKPFSARGPLRRRQQRPPRLRCWWKAERAVRACQGGELSSLPGTGPGCWGPFPTGTANGNAGSVSGALKPGAEPSVPVTTARLRGQRASPADGSTGLLTPACCTGPPARQRGAATASAGQDLGGDRLSTPQGGHAASGPRLPVAPVSVLPVVGGSAARGVGALRGPARAECLHVGSWGRAGPAAARCMLDGRRGEPQTASVPQVRHSPPYRHSHLAMVTPLTMHCQSTWAGRRGQHCSRPPRLWVSPPPSHPAVAVGEPVPAKHRLPGPSASLGTGRHTGVGRWRRVGALPWGQPLSHVPSPWSRPGH